MARGRSPSKAASPKHLPPSDDAGHVVPPRNREAHSQKGFPAWRGHSHRAPSVDGQRHGHRSVLNLLTAQHLDGDIEYAGWIWPVTPLENALRQAGGEAA